MCRFRAASVLLVTAWWLHASAPVRAQTAIELLTQQKETRSAALARQIAFCSLRIDTNHVAFRGCIDWHSAVHGMWGLVAYQRATGSRKFASLVGKLLTKDSIEAERTYLKKNPRFEMPYGRAWFLRLAIDHRLLTGSSLLESMADEVATSIRDHLRRGIARNSTSYESASWALINLLDYSRHRNLGELATEAEDMVKKEFVAPEPRCSFQAELSHFMAICTNRAALAARVLDRETYRTWLDDFIRANGLPQPTAPSSPHTYGLNFSRAWGLWDMHAKSGRSDVGEAYAQHFNRGYSPESNWRGDYRAVGHWVAQFGMFALQPLFGPQAGR